MGKLLSQALDIGDVQGLLQTMRLWRKGRPRIRSAEPPFRMIWSNSLNGGQPATMLGYPVVFVCT
jgi:hypothetical protein